MAEHRNPGISRLRSHYQRQRAENPPKRIQSDIVRDYRDDIVGLIADDGASLSEVVAAVRAEGEPVLEPGFKAEILKQIGTVKNIRAGRAKAVVANSAHSAPHAAVAPPVSKAIASRAAVFLDEDDEDFAARRPRG